MIEATMHIDDVLREMLKDDCCPALKEAAKKLAEAIEADIIKEITKAEGPYFML